ncbi:3,4-dihydroxy-2-butanone-4-phosphate synthase [Natrinema caseinilyticum]|uniref:3,4-dihydroxy-2-butanone-4-phosphate synthase n=1 Tax=Natrinema caseinilyticum TaxID=2961570 RepID=UPI0020C23F39|nr:3,4-dihydroxy-2-butanone-4-phosphate synthase [Natrinema caseinilyticum]
MSDRHPITDFDPALQAFREGKPVLIHDFDSREGETDIVYPAHGVEHADVARLRNDAGGLVCVALSYAAAERFELPFFSEAIDHPTSSDHDLDYDSRSSFSLTVNHRDTFTGITDEDRSKTIQELAAAASAPTEVDFPAEFRSPGHVHLLKAAPNLLSDRRGHTEFGITLANAAGTPPAVVVCEMLDDRSGRALSKEQARSYAHDHNIPFIDGSILMERFGPVARLEPGEHRGAGSIMYPFSDERPTQVLGTQD